MSSKKLQKVLKSLVKKDQAFLFYRAIANLIKKKLGNLFYYFISIT